MDYARYAAASLFYLAIHNQRDPAGLMVFDDEVRNYIRPSTRPASYTACLAGLEQAEPRGKNRLHQASDALTAITPPARHGARDLRLLRVS